MESPITMNYVDNLTGLQFEHFTGALLAKLGYKYPRVTRASNGGGIDVLAINNKGQRIGFQCKHSRCNAPVVESAVNETLNGVHYYNLDKAVIISNSHFCKNTLYECRKHHVVFWDRNKLVKLISNINSSNKLLHIYEMSNMDNTTAKQYTLKQKQLILFCNSLMKSHTLRNYINSLDEVHFKNFMIELFKIHKFGNGSNKFKDTGGSKLSGFDFVNIFKSNNYKYKLGIYFVHVEPDSSKIPAYLIEDDATNLSADHLKQCCFITNGYFTNKDLSIANKDNMILVDQDRLCSLVENLLLNINFAIVSNKFIELRDKLSLVARDLKKSYLKQPNEFRVHVHKGYIDPNNLLNYLT